MLRSNILYEFFGLFIKPLVAELTIIVRLILNNKVMSKPFYLFKIKFSYQAENETGALENKNLQVLAQCCNYTDAEKLALCIVERDRLDRFECSDPEITRLKTPVSGLLLNDTVDTSDDLTCKLVEVFFPNEGDSWYNVKIDVDSVVDEKVKKNKEEYLLPASSTTDAIKKLTPQMNMKDYKVTHTSIDKSELVYLTPETVEGKKKA